VETSRTLNRRLVVGTLALLCAVALVWAATALAGGTPASSTNERSGGTTPAGPSVQEEGGVQAGHDGRDCPEKGSGGDLQVAV
jgi:hypothetical protein